MKVVKVEFVNGLGKTKGCERAPEEILSCIKEKDFLVEGVEMFSASRVGPATLAPHPEPWYKSG